MNCKSVQKWVLLVALTVAACIVVGCQDDKPTAPGEGSQPGETWSVIQDTVSSHCRLYTMYASDSFFIAVGSCYWGPAVDPGDSYLQYTSTDGIAWSERWWSWTPEHGTRHGIWTTVYSIDSNDSLLVAGSWDGVYYVSADQGTTWTWYDDPDNWRLLSIVWADSMWVATSLRCVYTSPDAISWESHSVDSFDLDTRVWFTHIAWNGSVFVVYEHNSGKLYTSANAREWTARQCLLEGSLSGLTSGAGLFVAVGGDGDIVTSPDGITWTSRNGDTEDRHLADVCWTGTQFVAIGDRTETGEGLALSSPHGINWTPHRTGTYRALHRVAGNADRIVAVGEMGIIITSPAIPHISRWSALVSIAP